MASSRISCWLGWLHIQYGGLPTLAARSGVAVADNSTQPAHRSSNSLGNPQSWDS
ncbi:MAG: hypothetical protein U0401_27685 [Anaerolineae bacterium]